jgi:hypothetical protein
LFISSEERIKKCAWFEGISFGFDNFTSIIRKNTYSLIVTGNNKLLIYAYTFKMQLGIWKYRILNVCLSYERWVIYWAGDCHWSNKVFTVLAHNTLICPKVIKSSFAPWRKCNYQTVKIDIKKYRRIWWSVYWMNWSKFYPFDNVWNYVIYQFQFCSKQS